MTNITLNEEQQTYFDAIVSNVKQNHEDGAFDENFLLITGKAGSGKSTLSAKLAKYFIDNPVSKYGIQCTALTHKAKNELHKKLKSVGIEEEDSKISTVHSYFNIKAKINYKTGIEEFDVDSYAKKPKKCSLLFIDEVSMMDEKLFNLVKSQRHLYETIILIGDEFQVPPVNDSEYNLFQDVNIHKFKLNEIVRQAQDNPIIQLASEIVEKIENKDFRDKSYCIKRAIEYSKKTDKIEMVNNTRQLVEKYYEYVKDDISKPIMKSKFYKSFFTTFTNKTVNSLNYVAKCIYKNSNQINYLDVGDMLILQSPAFDIFLPDVIIAQNNAEIIITKLEEDTYENIPVYNAYFENDLGEQMLRVIKPEAVGLYEAHLEKLAQRARTDGRQWKVFYDFKKKFAEVKQSFACTTHKAQGSTVDRVFIDARDLPWNSDANLSFRLFYVAITRTSDKAIIMY
jgi:ATP-dependent exoDNAse (exonuclease V) alpha subunit